MKIKCNSCGKSYQYTCQDLEITNTRDDIEASLCCKNCRNIDVGSSKDLEKLIEDSPEYEPDSDLEFDSYNEELAQNFGGQPNENPKGKKL